MNHDDLPDYWKSLPHDGWLHEALCKGMPRKWWFSEAGAEGYAYAKSVCARCLVSDDCLAFGMKTEPAGLQYRHGIFGGMTPVERQAFADLLAEDRTAA